MSTRARVLSELREAGPASLSGEALARTLGVSRVAIGKHVSTLRELGYTIDAEPGLGYRLVAAPDLALPEEVEPLVTSALWTRFEGGPVTGSTNSDAAALSRSGAGEGTVVISARQTSGRGRLGREWASPPGGAYVSVVLRPVVAPSEAGSLALAVGLGVARGLERLGLQPRLKWPNDVLLADADDDGNGKLAGVLLEMSAEADSVEWVVAGFGINCSRPDAATPGAAYVSDHLPGTRAATVAAAALDGVAEEYLRWSEGGFGVLGDEYAARDSLAGNDVIVRDLSGSVRASGRCEGVDEQGRLLVRGSDGDLQAVSAGEVTLRSG